MTSNSTGTGQEAEVRSTPTSPVIPHKEPAKGILKSMKHSAHVVANEAVLLGGEIKTASKEMADTAVKGGKAACDSSGKAVLDATENALSAASRVTAKAARAVHKTNHSQ